MWTSRKLPSYHRMHDPIFLHAEKCRYFFCSKSNPENSKFLLFASKEQESDDPVIYNAWRAKKWTTFVSERVSRKENVDMELAVTCLRTIREQGNDFDHITIVSSDRDFFPVIQDLRTMKKEVTVWHHGEESTNKTYLKNLTACGVKVQCLTPYLPLLYLANFVKSIKSLCISPV